MSFTNLRQLFGAATLLLFMSACSSKTEDIITPTPVVTTEQTKVMFYNGGNANSYFTLNDKRVSDSMSAAKSTDYVSVSYTPSATNNIGYKTAAGTEATKQTVVLKKDANYSFFTWMKPLALGSPLQFGSIMVEDTLTAPSTGKAKLRAAVMSRDGAAAYDIAIESNWSYTNVFTNIAVGNVSSFVELDSGTYRFVFFNTGGSGNFGDVKDVKIEAGKIYTMTTVNTSGFNVGVTANIITNK